MPWHITPQVVEYYQPGFHKNTPNKFDLLVYRNILFLYFYTKARMKFVNISKFKISDM